MLKDNFSIKTKFYAALILLVVFILGGVYFVYNNIQEIIEVDLPRKAAVHKMQTNFKGMSQSVYQYEKSQSNQNIADSFKSHLSDYRKFRKRLTLGSVSKKEERLIDRLDKLMEEYTNIGQEIIQKGDNSNFEISQKSLFTKFDNLNSEINLLFDNKLQDEVESRIASNTQMIKYEFLIIILALVVGSIIIFVILKNILNRIENYGQTLNKITGGNLKERINIENQDELGVLAENINKMTDEILSEKIFNQTVLKSIGDGVIVLDEDKKIKLFNPVAEKITGYNNSEVIGEKFNDALSFVHEGTEEKNESFINKVYEKGEIQHMDRNTAIINKDGEQIPVTDSAAPIKDTDGNVDGVVIVFSDVIQQRQHKKDLQKFKKAVDSATNGIVITDRDFRVQYVNPLYEDMVNMPLSKFKGENANKVLTSDKVPKKVLDDLRNTLDKGKTFECDDFILANTQLEVNISIYPLMGDGEPEFFVAIVQDVSERKEMERQKDTFFSIASHQLRTPLGSMRWNIESILAGDLGGVPSDVEEVLQDVKEQNERLIKLVNNLLNVSRIEQGRVKNEPEIIDLNDMLVDVKTEMDPLAKEANVNLQFVKDENVPPIYLAKTELRDIIKNLTSNAIKYNKDDGDVTVETIFSGNNVKIRVSDTGIGIPEKDKDQIFNRFFRASNVTRKNVQGTGLGIAVAKMFMERWGGDIWFESEEGVGTVFHIVFPYDKIKPPEES